MPSALRCLACAFLVLVVIVAFCSGSSVSQAQNSTPTQQPRTPKLSIKFTDQTINLAAGASEGSGTLILTVEGTNLPTDASPIATDLGQPTDFTASSDSAKRLNAGQGFQNWLIPIRVQGLKAVGTRERYLTIDYAGFIETKPYSVDNAVPAGFAWKVIGPPTAGIAWRKAKALPVTISVGGSVSASNVKLLQPLLRDADSQETAEFKLCVADVDPCVAPSVLPAGAATTVYVRQVASTDLRPGTYTGTLAVSSSEQPQGSTFDATFDVTSNRAKLLGFAAILTGVMLSWLVTVYIRHLINRSRLRRIAAVLRLRLERLTDKLKLIDAQWCRTTSEQVSQTLIEMAEPRLKDQGYIPDLIPSATQDATTSEFQPFVTRMNSRIEALEAIASRGFEPLYALLKAQPGNEALKTAMLEIDAKAMEAGATPLPELTAEIVSLVAEAFTKIGLQQDAIEQAQSVRRLTYQIGSLNLASWLTVMVTTVLIGVLVLILPDKGFGQSRDYIICLLWGLGIPVAGAQLSQLNADSALTTFKLARPG